MPALAGTLGEDANCIYDIGIDAMSSILPRPMSLEDAIMQSETLVIQATESLIKSLLLGMKIAYKQHLAV